MKKILFLSLLLTMFFSCSNELIEPKFWWRFDIVRVERYNTNIVKTSTYFYNQQATVAESDTIVKEHTWYMVVDSRNTITETCTKTLLTEKPTTYIQEN